MQRLECHAQNATVARVETLQEPNSVGPYLPRLI